MEKLFYILSISFGVLHWAPQWLSADGTMAQERPTIERAARDTAVSCEVNYAAALENWLDDNGGLALSSEALPIDYQTIPTRARITTILDSLILDECNSGAQITVGFFGIDTCDLSSDTSFAAFQVLDTVAPVFMEEPQDMLVVCNDGRQDSLDLWLQTIAGAVLNDNCSDNVGVLRWNITDTQGREETISSSEASTIDISGVTTFCDYTLTVEFVVSDGCGNIDSAMANFQIRDVQAPAFIGNVGGNDTLRVSCSELPEVSAIMAADDCVGSIQPELRETTTRSDDINECAYYNYTLIRTYTATDDCGNRDSLIQTIFVTDMEAPSFVAPPDTIVGLATDITPASLGMPTSLVDNCADSIIVSFQDAESRLACQTIITRTWSVSDICGNTATHQQTIQRVEDASPQLVSAPENIDIDCPTTEDVDAGFQDWLSTNANIEVEDTDGEIIRMFAAVPGSYSRTDTTTWPGEVPSLEAAACPSSRIGYLRYRDVDFVYVDDCFNTLVVNAYFGVRDNRNPVITNAIEERRVFLSSDDDCVTAIDFQPLEVTDNCSGGMPQEIQSGRITITGNNNEAPIDTVVAVIGPIIGGLSGNVSLTIEMRNVDANDVNEYLLVYGEDGSLLGRTNLSSAQCGDVNTTLSVSNNLINDWLTDDNRLTITMIPFLAPGPTAGSINNVCQGGSVQVSIDAVPQFMGMPDQRIIISGVDTQFIDGNYSLTLPVGQYQVSQTVFDCASNESTLDYTLSVIDTLNRTSQCPADTTIVLSEDSCQATVAIPIIAGSGDCNDPLELTSIVISGASDSVITSFGDASSVIQILPVGRHQVVYNFGTGTAQQQCSYRITVEDNAAPTLLCLSELRLTLDPTGTRLLIPDGSELVAEVTDACGVRSVELDTPMVNCNAIGDTIQSNIFALDVNGQESFCNIPIMVLAYDLNPTAEVSPCGADTIRLFANVEADLLEGDTVDIRWTGPNGFNSNEENPVIINTGESLGNYELEITGANGCQFRTTLEVDGSALAQPTISLSDSVICDTSLITLTSEDLGSDVEYIWYQLAPDSSLLVDTTDVNNINIPITGSGSYMFYNAAIFLACDTTQVEGGDTVTLTALDQPELSFMDSIITSCPGGDVLLEANIDTTQDLTYNWTGPNGFSANSASVVIDSIDSLDIGLYQLQVSLEGSCSDSAQVRIRIVDSLLTPTIATNSLGCLAQATNLFVTNYEQSNVNYQWFVNNTPYDTISQDTLTIPRLVDSLTGEWVVIASQAGCTSDTSNTLMIDIQDTTSITISIADTVCSGDSIVLSTDTLAGMNTYVWTGPDNFRDTAISTTVLALNGEYQLQVATGSGCIFVESQVVTTVDRPRVVNVRTEGVLGCVDTRDTFFLIPTIESDVPITSYQWSGPGGFNSTDSIVEVTTGEDITGGFYSVTAMVGTCVSNLGGVFLEPGNQLETPILSDEEISVCAGDSFRIDVTNEIFADTFIWLTPTGDTIFTSEPSLHIPSDPETSFGAYNVIGINGGCISPVSDTVIVNNVGTGLPRPVILSNEPLCEGQDLILQVEPPGGNVEVLWQDPNNFFNDTTVMVIGGLMRGDTVSYTVQYSTDNCESPIATFSGPTFVDMPVAPEILNNDFSICSTDADTQGITLCLADIGGGRQNRSFVWRIEGGDVLDTVTTTCARITDLSSFVQGDNTIEVVKLLGTCSSLPSAPIVVTVSDEVDNVVNAGVDTFICDTTFTLVGTSTDDELSRWFSIDPDVTVVNPNADTSVVNGLQLGEQYRFVLSASQARCGANMQDTVVVTVGGGALVLGDDVDTVMAGETVMIDILSNDIIQADSFEIFFESDEVGGVFDYNTASRILQFQSEDDFEGTFNIEYEICSSQCEESCSTGNIAIVVQSQDTPNRDCMIPTIFTPNNDGVNDLLIIDCIDRDDLTNNELYIFDEWGNEVFIGQPYQNNWDGTSNGELLPNGTYYYIFKTDATSSEHFNGFVILQY